MTISSVGGRSAQMVQGLVDMRRQLDDLQQQLSTGKKTTSYAGLGLDRSLAVGLHAQLATMSSQDSTLTLVGTRLQLQQQVLTRLGTIGSDARAAFQKPGELKAGGQADAQVAARAQLDEVLNLLNTQAGDRTLFAGKGVDGPAVASTGDILDGDGARAGLKQVISERAQADLGTGNSGRLVVAGTPGAVSLAEDAAGSPYGFKLASASTTLTGATLSGPAGTPPQIGLALAANPNAGESLAVTLRLPDGSQETLRLTATTASPPAAGEFTIGATPADTATNLQAALGDGVQSLAKTSLKAASALAAADDFFNTDAAHPPRRVDGPPFATATAQISGTPANTVVWYTGEAGAEPARTSVTSRADGTISVNYGVRANEEGIRSLVQNIAAFAATSFDPSDASTAAAYTALSTRAVGALAGGGAGKQSVQDIASDLGNAQVTLQAAKDRHTQAAGVLGGLLDQVEGAPSEQVAAQVLTLQVRLQASLQTTSILYQLNLTNYL